MFNKMNHIKAQYTKLFISILIAAFILVNGGLSYADSLQDLHLSSDYAKDAIMSLSESNIIAGDEYGNFNPKKTVTRAEMIKMIVNALEVDTTTAPDAPTFSDVPKTHWSYKYVEAAYREGIIKGLSEDVFGKNDQCTREQMAVMFVRSIGLSDEAISGNTELTLVNELMDKEIISVWAKGAVDFSLASGLMNGTGSNTFAPKGHAQREQVAVVTHRLISNKENILELAINTKESVKYPNLYEAIRSNSQYQGEFSMNSSMNLNGTTPEETMNIAMTATGAVNGSDSKMKFIMSMTNPEFTLSDLTFEVIQVGNKVYTKEPDSEIWWESSLEGMEGTGSLEMDQAQLQRINEQFLEIYKDLPIKEAGMVEINGVQAGKYTLSLNSESIKALIPEEFFEENMDLGMFFDTDQFNFEIEYYLNGQNQIIKQILTFDGNFPEEALSFDMSIDVNYYNIGADIIISPPAADSIEILPDEFE